MMIDNDTNKFTKSHTQIAKGIAIILMVYHHLFVLPERLGNNYISVINLLGYDFQSIIANFSKICVGIFLFLSGIGMYYTLIHYDSLKKMYVKVGIHGLKFMLNFWIIALFLLPIGIIRGFFQFTVIEVTYVIFAAHDYVMEWWFVRMYIVILIITPMLIRLFQRITIKKRLLPLVFFFAFWLTLKIILQKTNPIGEMASLKELFYSYFVWFENFDCIIIFICGMLCAKTNAIKYFLREKPRDRAVLSLFFIFTAIVVRVMFSNHPATMNVDFVVVPLFVLPLTSILSGTKAGSVFMWFGKHSTNIWLTHTFWCYYFGQKIVLLPRYSVLIFVWLMLLSIASSYLINILYLPVSRILFSRNIKNAGAT